MNNIFEVDPYEAARRTYEKQMFAFMANIMHHFGITQIELPNYILRDDVVIEKTELWNKNATLYRIKGCFELENEDVSKNRNEVC